MTDKLHELAEEFATVVAGRTPVIDTILPPLLFLVINAAFGIETAIWGAVVVALLITGLRLRRRQSLIYALAGLGGVLLAFLLAQVLGRAEGFFLPGMITGALSVIVAIASILVKRPMVAWTSYLARRWPLAWYWHPRVRPAYTEVTWLWALFFGLRLLLQFSLFQEQAAGQLAVAQVLTGWPATVVLLIVTYLYGTWRLKELGGPSVEEFKAGSPPPWKSQHRGF